MKVKFLHFSRLFTNVPVPRKSQFANADHINFINIPTILSTFFRISFNFSTAHFSRISAFLHKSSFFSPVKWNFFSRFFLGFLVSLLSVSLFRLEIFYVSLFRRSRIIFIQMLWNGIAFKWSRSLSTVKWERKNVKNVRSNVSCFSLFTTPRFAGEVCRQCWRKNDKLNNLPNVYGSIHFRLYFRFSPSLHQIVVRHRMM